MWRGRLSVVAAGALTLMAWGCADEPAPQEPIGDAKEEPAKMGAPDAPGNTGETKEKPAGEGQATPGAPAPTAAPAAAAAPTEPPLPAAEKSAPNKEAAAKAAAGAGKMMAVTAGVLNVRSGPGLSHPVVRTLKKGEKVEAPSGCKGGWCQISDKEFVSHKFLRDAF